MAAFCMANMINDTIPTIARILHALFANKFFKSSFNEFFCSLGGLNAFFGSLESNKKEHQTQRRK